MVVGLKIPKEFLGVVNADLNKRKGVIVGNDQDGDDFVITAHVPLNNMYGYSTVLCSLTQGKGEFTCGSSLGENIRVTLMQFSVMNKLKKTTLRGLFQFFGVIIVRVWSG